MFSRMSTESGFVQSRCSAKWRAEVRASTLPSIIPDALTVSPQGSAQRARLAYAVGWARFKPKALAANTTSVAINNVERLKLFSVAIQANPVKVEETAARKQFTLR